MNSLVSTVWFFLLCGTASTHDESKSTPFHIHHKMSNDELQKYFGVSNLVDVPEYDISYPVLVNDQGNPISGKRAKRDVNKSGQKYFSLTAFGNKLHLNVTLNKNLIGPNFYVETKHKNGSRAFADTPHRNFYHGHVVSQPNSLVAISENRGVSGAIRVIDSEMLFVQPLPDRLSEFVDQFMEQQAHLVVKRSASEFMQYHKQMFEEEVLPQKKEERISAEDEIPGQPGHKFLEVVYVGDHLITEQIGLIELPEMLLIIGNIVARMFTDSTFGERKLTYVVIKLVILNNGELNYLSSASNGARLGAFGRWLRGNNPANDNDPEHADTGTLFTSNTGGGLAVLGGMCSYRDVRSIVGSIGLASSAIAAHENFHNLGFGHDVDRGCPNGANIMSTFVPSGSAAFTWSSCSRQYIQNYLSSGRSHCLNDAPVAKRPTLPPLIRGRLPGTIFNGDKQCELKYSVGYKQCFKQDCHRLFCTPDGSACISSGGTPADGTTCGEGKWCIRSECVDNGLPPIDGNWGSWSEYSSCTRTCGSGVQYRTRKCDNPRPKNKGKPCSGSSKGEYRKCNVNTCPAGSTSFRDFQCKQKSPDFWPFIRPGAECYLWCRRGNLGYLRGQVRDGTRCSNNPNNHDVCINGKCQAVGCDYEIPSEKVNDRCGICDGDGSSCEFRTVKYTKDYRTSNFSNADTMVVIEKGSSLVRAKKRRKTKNTIGVQNSKGEYLINLPSGTTTVHKAGTKITYIHRKERYKDEIIIPGPVNEELHLVFVYMGEKNQGVDIQYYAPVKNVSKPSKDLFYWSASGWSACSKTCAGGKSYRKLTCFRRDDNSRAGVAACPKETQPLSEKSCNTQDCDPQWYSSLTSCSKTCGKGVQTRKTVCRRMTVNSWAEVNNSECAGPPPANLPLKRDCNKIACPPEYVALLWSQCSTTCGEGTTTRMLKCVIINDAGLTITVPNVTCEHHNAIKPSTKEKCNFDKPCVSKPQYVGIGCFKEGRGKYRVLPNLIKNLRPQINCGKLNATVEPCARLASEHDVKYFAIQFYGECWASSNATAQFDKYGPSEKCWDGVGGKGTNYVYKLIKKP